MTEMTTKSRQPVSLSHLADSGPLGWFRGEIDRLFEEFGRPAGNLFNFATHVAGPQPVMELRDNGKDYRLSAELPGLAADDVELEVADGVLTISGEKKQETERKEGGYLLSERRYGSFARQIALPSDVDCDAITAKFEHGVLRLTLGKDQKAAARVRKVAIAR